MMQVPGAFKVDALEEADGRTESSRFDFAT